MTKVGDFLRHWGRYGRKVIVSITPPIVTAGIRKARSHLLRHHAEAFPLPHPSEYSPCDNPLEVPCQVEAYLLCRDRYLKPSDVILDVGFGLGYGLQIMAAKAENLVGLDIDARATARARRIFEGHPRIKTIELYDGKSLPFGDKTFDVVTCIEVIEHVKDYKSLLLELSRVSRRLIFLATPNRRPEYTLPDGQPKNYWHIREWSFRDLDTILQEIPNVQIEWNFIDGPWEGPFVCTTAVSEDTLALAPVLMLDPPMSPNDRLRASR